MSSASIAKGLAIWLGSVLMKGKKGQKGKKGHTTTKNLTQLPATIASRLAILPKSVPNKMIEISKDSKVSESATIAKRLVTSQDSAQKDTTGERLYNATNAMKTAIMQEIAKVIFG